MTVSWVRSRDRPVSLAQPGVVELLHLIRTQWPTRHTRRPLIRGCLQVPVGNSLLLRPPSPDAQVQVRQPVNVLDHQVEFQFPQIVPSPARRGPQRLARPDLHLACTDQRSHLDKERPVQHPLSVLLLPSSGHRLRSSRHQQQRVLVLCQIRGRKPLQSRALHLQHSPTYPPMLSTVPR